MNDQLETVVQMMALLDEADRPIYALDRCGRVAYCNAALTDWLQMEARHVLGRRVEYHSEPTDRKFGDGEHAFAPLTDLCPPPKVFAGVEVTATVSCVHRSGHLSHRRARFLPLKINLAPPHDKDSSADSGPGISILGILEPSDLTTAELSQALAAEPSADTLHRVIRRFRHDQFGRYAPDALLGQSPAMRKVRAQVRAAAESSANVLMVGRPGTGLVRIAKSVHYAASRGDAIPLVTLDGHLTTADLLRRSCDSLERSCDARQRGTLLITDIDQLAAELQMELVRWLESTRFNIRLMGTRSDRLPKDFDHSDRSGYDRKSAPEPPIDARLHDLVSTIVICAPSLVGRLGDLPVLVQYFLEEKNQRQAAQVGSVAGEALERLALYSWPGELKELREVIGQAHDACQGSEITPADLPVVIHHAVQAALSSRQKTETIVLDDFLSQIERQLIERAMRLAAGNKTEAARLLGVTRPRLYRRLDQLGWAGGDAKDDDA